MCLAEREEVECSECAGSERCWNERVPAHNGFLVRRVRPLEAGEVLYRQGDLFDAPHVVTSGCLLESELLENGLERVVAFRLPGEWIGLESMTSPRYRHGVRAVSSSTVCRLRWSAAGLKERSAPLLRALIAKGLACETSPPWPGLSSVDRVRAFVEDFTRRTHQPLPMSRAQIGQYLGLAEETVVRAFAELRRRSRLRTPERRGA